MTGVSNVDQHLEMMLNKKNRCEDWVTSVNLRKQYDEQDLDSVSEKVVSELSEECSDEVCDSSIISHRRTRKIVVNEKLSLFLTCAWYNCDYGSTECKSEFTQHVSIHISDVPVIQKSDGNPCYQCLWDKCDFLSVNASEIKRHIYFHAYQTSLKAVALRLNTLWELPHCSRDIASKNWLPDLSSSFKCQISVCEYETDIFDTFIGHVNSHVDCLDLSVEPVMVCKWKGCNNFKCRKKTYMKIHLRKHTGEKSLACPSCGTMFASNTKYMDHCNRKVPIRDESNQCQYCLRYYPNDRLLRDHMRYHINSQKCSFCEMTFSTPAVLANHIRYKHINARPFECSQCPFTAVKANDFDLHMAIHETQPKYRCDDKDCNYSCRSVKTLKKHFNSVHLKTAAPIYQCHLCDKEYNRGMSLGTHLRAIHKLERLPGHSRFRYMENKDGYYRLQVERYESLELNKFRGPPELINYEMKFSLKEELRNNEDFPKKFSIVVHESEEKKTESSVIAIDELDEHGNVVYSTTVQKELMNNSDFYFVDVGKCADVDHHDGVGNTIENTVESEKASNLIKETEVVRIPKKRRKTVNFSNHDCTLNELIIRND